MAKIASRFRWLLLALWFFLGPLLLAVWNGYIVRADVGNNPWGWVTWLAGLPGIHAGSLLFTGLVVGVWVDWILRRIDGSRADDRRALGVRFCNLAHTIEDRFRCDDRWPSNIVSVIPNITSAFIEADKYGVWTPADTLYENPNGGNLMVYYLLHVGTLLRDGHFREARVHSLQAKALASQSTSAAISP
ncbi:hypothetical protein QA640_09240 [Bradyrhizobium sp. CB82]|uniref:hypothetical protein n=1 Tax=Bradyrhizobium sp. CB82 TaxID=3039159 RepID=UPI0024B1C790|nr:hypothetical protein [Bradyrhizobium sp. CB82]WFU42619.1 hypothetical protein QA640_09240 [Bradyrhizobium sp. CB82]